MVLATLGLTSPLNDIEVTNQPSVVTYTTTNFKPTESKTELISLDSTDHDIPPDADKFDPSQWKGPFKVIIFGPHGKAIDYDSNQEVYL